MDLIYTCYSQPQRNSNLGKPSSNNDSSSSDTLFPPSLSSVSCRNVLLFSKQNKLSNKTEVLVCDLNTPWDVSKVTEKSSPISVLKWDPESGTSFVLTTVDGEIELWTMERNKNNSNLNNVESLSNWRCLVREIHEYEMFLSAGFVHNSRKTYLNNEKMDSIFYSEKFQFVKGPAVGLPFGQKSQTCIILISQTGLALCITITLDGMVQMKSKCLGGQRSRVKQADLAFLKDGQFVVALSDGNPELPIRFFNLVPGLDANDDLTLEVEDFPSIFLQSQGKQDDNDPFKSVVNLKFVKEEDSDAILIATQNALGGKVVLWELKNITHIPHKMFTNTTEGVATKMVSPLWEYVEVFQGPSSPIVALSTPSSTLQTGFGSPCYITVGYGDGSIQLLLRDSLQQIGSVELPKAGNYSHDPSHAKIPRVSVNISSISFTATGNAMVALDSLGQLYLYCLSPISDPGGPHTVPYLLTFLEFCLVSGKDVWDLVLCCKPQQIEMICDKLTHNFEKQPVGVQNFYRARFNLLKMTLYGVGFPQDHRSGDILTIQMLTTIHSTFKSLIRSTTYNHLDPNHFSFDTIAKVLDSKSEECDVDVLVNLLLSHQKDLISIVSHIQLCQNLVQWVCTLALHLLASVPDLKLRKGPGFELFNNTKVLGLLRQLLLFFRFFSKDPGTQPIFTKTDESFDVVGKLFALITKLMDNENDESFQDDCLRLPSQVILPPLNLHVQFRGVAPSVVAYHINPMNYEFGSEPNDDLIQRDQRISFFDGPIASGQIMDCLRQTYLGKDPFMVKECTRTFAVTSYQSSGNKTMSNFWDSRWNKMSPYGGNWILRRSSASTCP